MQMPRGYHFASDTNSLQRADKILQDISLTISGLENFTSLPPVHCHGHHHCHQHSHNICHHEVPNETVHELEVQQHRKEENKVLERVLKENSALQQKVTELNHELEASHSQHEALESVNIRNQKSLENVQEQHRQDMEKIAHLQAQIKTKELEMKTKEQTIKLEHGRLFDFVHSIAKLVGKSSSHYNIEDLDGIVDEVSDTLSKVTNEDMRWRHLALEVQKVENELDLGQEMLARLSALETQPQRPPKDPRDSQLVQELQEKVKKLSRLLHEASDELERVKVELKDHAELKTRFHEQTAKIHQLEVSLAQFQRVCERQREHLVDMKRDFQDKDYSISETLGRKDVRMSRLERLVESTKTRDEELLRLRTVVAQLLGIEKRVVATSDSICLHEEIVKRLKKLMSNSSPGRHIHPQCIAEFEHRKIQNRIPSASRMSPILTQAKRPVDGSRFHQNCISVTGLRNPQLTGHRIHMEPMTPSKIIHPRARSTSPSRNFISPTLH